MSRTRALIASLLGLVMLGGLAACSSDGPDVYEQPTYYGANGQCYVLDPSDLLYLQQAGLCPVGWVPVMMPGWFEDRYYYAIQHRYVTVLPAPRQKTTIKVVNNYYDKHKDSIGKAESSYTSKVNTSNQQSSNKTYKSGNGDRAGGATSKVSTSKQSTSTSTYRSSSKK